MPKSLFNKILDETLQLPASFTPDRKERMYNYAFTLAKPDYRKGSRVLITEGNVAESFYFLLRGYCRFFYYSKNRNQELIPFLLVSPGILAEGRSFEKMRPARFSIEVSASSEVYRLNRAAITSIEQKYPEVSPFIRLMIKKQNHEFKSWKKGLVNHTATDRYLKLHTLRPDVLKYILKKDIAGHLGIKAPSFSRLLRTFDLG